jgi:hypothetical protein
MDSVVSVLSVVSKWTTESTQRSRRRAMDSVVSVLSVVSKWTTEYTEITEKGDGLCGLSALSGK